MQQQQGERRPSSWKASLIINRCLPKRSSLWLLAATLFGLVVTYYFLLVRNESVNLEARQSRRRRHRGFNFSMDLSPECKELLYGPSLKQVARETVALWFAQNQSVMDTLLELGNTFRSSDEAEAIWKKAILACHGPLPDYDTEKEMRMVMDKNLTAGAWMLGIYRCGNCTGEQCIAGHPSSFRGQWCIGWKQDAVDAVQKGTREAVEYFFMD